MPRPKYRAPVKKEHKERLEAFNFASSWRRRSHVSLYSPMGSRLPSRRGSRSVNNRDSIEARRKSIAQQSGKTGTTSRSNSIAGSYEPKSKPNQRAAQPTALQSEPEQSGDDDVANVGVSRVNSREKPPRISVSAPEPAADVQAPAATAPRGAGLADRGDRSDGYGDRSTGHGLHGHRRGRRDEHCSTSEMQEAPESKKDSGPPSQHIVGFITNTSGHKMFTEDDLARALERNHMTSEAIS